MRRAIPRQALFIDIARFEVVSFVERGKWQAHYVAWLIPAADQGEVRIVDLGAAEEIDALTARVREQMQAASGADGLLRSQGEAAVAAAINADLQKLAERVWHPLAAHAGVRDLILSPDGALWLVPWAALPSGRDGGEVLLEKFGLRFVISGRDLVTAPETIKPTGATIMADPKFSQTAAEKRTAIQTILKQVPKQDPAANRGSVTGGLLPKVSSLPGTAAEAAAIQPNVERFAGGQQAYVYKEGNALESIAKKFYRPKVAVFATHGFFLSDQPSRAGVRELSATYSETRAVPVDTAGKPLENPLLRCGLLLAGCNDRTATVGDDDGILTGMEICGIDFRGTDLVVLSACETGVGQVNNGEGIAGLRQAFQLAGAKSVVSTLWQIPDKQSAVLMNDFFTNLAAGQAKAEALRNAQLAMIKSRREKFGAAHPLFWAAWTVTGD